MHILQPVFPRYSIRSRLAVLTAVICFLFFTGIAWALGESMRVRTERVAMAELEALSVQIADVLDETIYRRYRDIEFLSNLNSIRSPDYSEIEKRVLLESIQHTYPEFSWVGLTDANGIVRVSTGGLLEGMDVSARPWFQGGREARYFGDVHEAALLGPLLGGDRDEPLRFVDVAVPIYSADGSLTGVLGAHLDWDWAAEVQRAILSPFAHRPGLKALILSTTGTVLLGTISASELSASGVPTSDMPTSDVPTISSIDLLTIAAQNPQQSASMVVELLPNETFLAGYTSSQGYRNYPGLGWHIVVVQSTADAFGEAREVQRSILLWGLGLGALLATFIWFMAGNIVGPLISIAKAADRIAQGQKDGSIPVIAGEDEVASLSRSLHTLVHRLRLSAERLQSLHTIDRAIMQTDELAATLDVIVRETQQKLGADAVGILLVDEGSNQLHFASGAGFNTSVFREVDVPVGAGVSGRIAADRELVFLTDATAQGSRIRADAFRAEGFMGYAGAPLVNQGALVGVLEIHHRRPFEPDDAWRDFLQSLALQTGIAIEHARLFTETRRLLAQTEFQAHELSQILESVPSGIVLLDPKRAVQHQNKVAERYLEKLAHYDEDGRIQFLNGRPIDELLVHSGPDEPWHVVMDEANQRVYEVAAHRLGEDGTSENWVMVIEDTTADRYRQQQMQLQERLATVGQLSAGIAHDFNNILTPIFIYGNMLAGMSQDAKFSKGLQNIMNAASRAKELIAQILAFSRGRGEVAREQLELQPIIGEVLNLLEAVLPASIVIRQHVEPQVQAIYGDTSQIHQVLMNLCTNAFQAMPEGGTLTIGLHTVAAEQMAQRSINRGFIAPDEGWRDYAHLSVADTGTGMNRETLQRVFEPFFTTKALGEGTGMGLSMVHEIVKEHKGFIEIDSTLGEGTTFHIYLPIADERMMNGQPGVAAAAGLNSGHLLVVDDEESILAALKEALEATGYRVTAVAYSQEALATVREVPQTFDLMLTDLNMPHLAGDELIREVRGIRPEMPILLMSGSAKLLSRSRVQNAGASAILTKPFTIQELLQTIHAALEPNRTPAESKITNGVG